MFRIAIGLYQYHHPILNTVVVNILLYFTPVLEKFDPMLEFSETNIGDSLTSVGLCTCPMLQTLCPMIGFASSERLLEG